MYHGPFTTLTYTILSNLNTALHKNLDNRITKLLEHLIRLTESVCVLKVKQFHDISSTVITKLSSSMTLWMR